MALSLRNVTGGSFGPSQPASYWRYHAAGFGFSPSSNISSKQRDASTPWSRSLQPQTSALGGWRPLRTAQPCFASPSSDK